MKLDIIENSGPALRGVPAAVPTGGALVRDEPVVVHCYTTPEEIEDANNLGHLARFCRRMGRATNLGEIGLVIGDEYFAIRNFREE